MIFLVCNGAVVWVLKSWDNSISLLNIVRHDAKCSGKSAELGFANETTTHLLLVTN